MPTVTSEETFLQNCGDITSYTFTTKRHRGKVCEVTIIKRVLNSLTKFTTETASFTPEEARGLLLPGVGFWSQLGVSLPPLIGDAFYKYLVDLFGEQKNETPQES